jgi:hypothetical protein
LNRPACDQDPFVRGEPGGKRGKAEQRQAECEQAAGAEQVGRPAAEEQEPAEADGVRRYHPLQVPRTELQRAADVRQRDVDDVVVESDQELAEREHGQLERGGFPHDHSSEIEGYTLHKH